MNGRALLGEHFRLSEFEHSLNVYAAGSKLQVQIQKDPSLEELLSRAQEMEVDELMLPVASPADLVGLKVAAAMEPTRRRLKRGKDRLDLARLIMEFPDLKALIPEELKADVFSLLDPDE